MPVRTAFGESANQSGGRSAAGSSVIRNTREGNAALAQFLHKLPAVVVVPDQDHHGAADLGEIAEHVGFELRQRRNRGRIDAA